MPRVPKTKEQIMKSNLNKMLNKMKTKVAEKEDIWLETFHCLLPCMISYEDNTVSTETLLGRIRLVSLLTDEVISCYESRWGG